MYSLNHPYILKLFNHYEDDTNIYLILEFAPCVSNLFNIHNNILKKNKNIFYLIMFRVNYIKPYGNNQTKDLMKNLLPQ
jgi:serine/threonine protein kinase